jgi:hypothetical protein
MISSPETSMSSGSFGCVSLSRTLIDDLRHDHHSVDGSNCLATPRAFSCKAKANRMLSANLMCAGRSTISPLSDRTCSISIATKRSASEMGRLCYRQYSAALTFTEKVTASMKAKIARMS